VRLRFIPVRPTRTATSLNGLIALANSAPGCAPIWEKRRHGSGGFSLLKELIMRVQMLAATIAAIAFVAPGMAQLPGPSVPAQPAATALTVPDTQALAVSLPDAAKHRPILTGHVATATRGFVMQSTGGYWLSSCPNNQNCNNGAGSFRSDLGFAFGPTRSFFDPCGPRILPDCSGCAKCRTPILGHGPCGPWPHCTYDSYLNH
jgi:hypothetical protein